MYDTTIIWSLGFIISTGNSAKSISCMMQQAYLSLDFMISAGNSMLSDRWCLNFSYPCFVKNKILLQKKVLWIQILTVVHKQDLDY